MCSTRFMNECSACCHKRVLLSATQMLLIWPQLLLLGFHFWIQQWFLFARHFHDLIKLDTFSAVNRNFVVTAILFHFCSWSIAEGHVFIYIYKLWSDHYASAAAETGGSLAATNICGCNSWTVVSDYHWQWGGKQLSCFLFFFYSSICFGVWSHMLASIYAHYLEPWSALPVGCGCLWWRFDGSWCVWGALFGTILG